MNIVFFHLESMNMSIYRWYGVKFPNIKAVEKESVFYTDYYSSATSTYMVMSDLLYGRTDTFRNCKGIKEIFDAKTDKKSFLDELSAQGYNTKIYRLTDEKPTDDSVVTKKLGVFSRKAQYWWGSDKENFAKNLSEFIASSESDFAIHVQDFESHIYQMFEFAEGENLARNMFEKRFINIDNTLGTVIECLKKSGRYDDTLLVLYGDHGDDFWGRGINNGYTHAIEPYTALMHCPLMIRYPGKAAGTDNRVTNTTEVVDIVKALLENKEYTPSAFAYSRNLFAAQDEKKFKKGYAVTNGIYTLLAGTSGIRLYMNVLEIERGRNLLDFFTLDGEGLKYKTQFKGLKSQHFTRFMNEEQVKDITENYKALRERLIAFIESEYQGINKDLKLDRIVYSEDIKDWNRKSIPQYISYVGVETARKNATLKKLWHVYRDTFKK